MTSGREDKSGPPGSSDGKESSRQCRRCGLDPWVREDPLGKEMATHARILAWKIPWTEEPGGLQSMGSQRVRHDIAGRSSRVLGWGCWTSREGDSPRVALGHPHAKAPEVQAACLLLGGRGRGLCAAWGPSKAGSRCIGGAWQRLLTRSSSSARPGGSLGRPSRSARAEQTKIPGCACLGQVQH